MTAQCTQRHKTDCGKKKSLRLGNGPQSLAALARWANRRRPREPWLAWNRTLSRLTATLIQTSRRLPIHHHGSATLDRAAPSLDAIGNMLPARHAVTLAHKSHRQAPLAFASTDRERLLAYRQPACTSTLPLHTLHHTWPLHMYAGACGVTPRLTLLHPNKTFSVLHIARLTFAPRLPLSIRRCSNCWNVSAIYYK